jgi:hypothetical protein
VNASARPATWPIVEAQGFSRYGKGVFIAIPALSRGTAPARLMRIRPGMALGDDIGPFEGALLSEHAGFGCLSILCRAADGAHPFVFARRDLKGVLPSVQRVYCRSIEDFVRHARRIGWYLAARGICCVQIDANGPIAGLTGRYFSDRMPKFVRGATGRARGTLPIRTSPCSATCDGRRACARPEVDRDARSPNAARPRCRSEDDRRRLRGSRLWRETATGGWPAPRSINPAGCRANALCRRSAGMWERSWRELRAPGSPCRRLPLRRAPVPASPSAAREGRFAAEDVDHAILPGRDDAAAVCGKRKRRHRSRMPAKYSRQSAAMQIPQLY